MEILSRYDSGEVNCAKLGDDVVCATPSLDRKMLRELAKRAGVTIVCDADCTVYADNRIAGLFPKDDFEGTVRVFDEEKYVKMTKNGYKIFENKTEN